MEQERIPKELSKLAQQTERGGMKRTVGMLDSKVPRVHHGSCSHPEQGPGQSLRERTVRTFGPLLAGDQIHQVTAAVPIIGLVCCMCMCHGG